MNKSIFKAVLGGIIVGVAAFFVPKFVVGFLLFMGIIRLIGCCKPHGCCGGHRQGHKVHFADKIRSMSEAEYAEFKSKMDGGCCKGNKCETEKCEETK